MTTVATPTPTAILILILVSGPQSTGIAEIARKVARGILVRKVVAPALQN